ncbi:proline iminopeptidase-family hydrolase [Bradyrhizobium sp. Ec3.3]|uniref:proline iminopeptidase-family hydrolase n=1 Tax=Bradyrhizobium sp. Ec3.3 TaxID=189753 RepID=UPI000558E629|nr:proline iminopeptidase-family hydrolase [Bradyrhizobium sp. Ec3.3]
MTQARFADAYVSAPGGRVWMRRCGGSAKAPLITLHGGPGSPHDYLEPLAALGDEREIVFYDQLGCGRSDRPADTSLWTIDRFVAELDAVVETVGRKPVHLLGHSWGAMLAVDYAFAHPENVASLILDSPCLSMRRVRSDMQRLRAALPPSVQRVLDSCEAAGNTDSGAYGAAAMVFYRRHVCRKPDWPEPLMRSQENWAWPVYHTMWGPAEFTPVGNLADYEREDGLSDLNRPVLYLCGRHDEITPEATAAYHQQTPGSEFVVFEDSAHVQHLEEPELYEAVVRGFLARAETVVQ